jgi:hypothetical protein
MQKDTNQEDLTPEEEVKWLKSLIKNKDKHIKHLNILVEHVKGLWRSGSKS